MSHPIYNILSPTGGFANHIRWLMLLDPQYCLVVGSTDSESLYKKLQGNGWPSYYDYISNNYLNIDVKIINEINNLPFLLNFTTLDYKLNAYRRHIYPTTRTWHNWLAFERQWRDQLNDTIGLGHNYIDLIDINRKTLILTIDPLLAYKSYVKFNSLCNNLSMSEFQSSIVADNTKHMAAADEKTLVLNADILFNEVLDRSWYQQLITWFNLADNYASACIVHKLWYNAHKRAEQEIVTDLTKLYSNNQIDNQSH
jgi:hypothetical protein